MTLMEVKCHQRSTGVNYVLWSNEPLMQAKNDDDLHGGQRSSEVKYGNLCSRLPYLVKRIANAIKNDDDLHGGQRSSEVKCGKVCAMPTIFGQMNC